MDLRLQFISDHLSGVFTISELSREYQISRKTAYKWIDRYEAGGATALVDRSRRPHHLPNATPSSALGREEVTETTFSRTA
jgi:transposase